MLSDKMTELERAQLAGAMRDVAEAQRKLFEAQRNLGEAHERFVNVERSILESHRVDQATKLDLQ